MCRMATVQSVLSGHKTWTFEQEEEQRSQDQMVFYTMQRINLPRFHSEYNKLALLPGVD
ncbi:unnamed protein product [Staurois parvus]|uniref:Uncharacterized protein n=1 Tax=Staurois parvus TaxID=386267 RepID=A0ABN9GXN9_9NEOB|nr:unnamed protein product [Staurois parvus]